MPTAPNHSQSRLVERTEARRVRESAELSRRDRGELGQFFTPAPIASLLASAFHVPGAAARVLDPGAGVGSLTAALLARAVAEGWPAPLRLCAIEVDEGLLPALKETLDDCQDAQPSTETQLLTADFIEWASGQINPSLLTGEPERFELVILNPPYRKLHTSSRERGMLSAVGIEVTNLYAAFVALSLRLLAPGGQLVAITPRSFCNGPYFKAFRREILRSSALRRIHVFESRGKAFRDTEVLQENVIIHLVMGAEQGDVIVASSDGSGGGPVTERRVPFSSVVHLGDANAFIHIVSDDDDGEVASRMRTLSSDIHSIGVSVSTGRVVDFRVREYLRTMPAEDTVPLLYPLHLREGRIQWPAPCGKKPNALAAGQETRKLLLPQGNYVLVKRFSSKEERRRVVATVLQTDDLDAAHVAIENHINVFHHSNAGLSLDLAWGIATYLNSTIVDRFFRQFNGHTQVNATDLRSLRFPSIDQLTSLGVAARSTAREQRDIDAVVERIVPQLAGA